MVNDMRWIDVEIEMPNNTRNVLVFAYWNFKWQVLLAYRHDYNWWTASGNMLYDVTHWMELPEGPKKNEDG